MLIRRSLLLSLVLCCVYNVVRADEIHAVSCAEPPRDGYSWTRYDRPGSGRVVWVQVRTPEQFAICKPRATTFACAIRYQDLTVIYALNPREFYSEAAQIHEECHDGWFHGEPPIVSIYR